MEDLTEREERVARQFADQSMSGLIAEWDEPMPERERERELLRAEMESRGYRTASLVEPEAAPAEPPEREEPRTPRSSAADHPGVLERTRSEALRCYAFAAVPAAVAAWVMFAFDIRSSFWAGALWGGVGAAFAVTRVVRVKIDASADELLEAMARIYVESDVLEHDGPAVHVRYRHKTALVPGQLRLQEVEGGGSIVVGNKVVLDSLTREEQYGAAPRVVDEQHPRARHRTADDEQRGVRHRTARRVSAGGAPPGVTRGGPRSPPAPRPRCGSRRGRGGGRRVRGSRRRGR